MNNTENIEKLIHGTNINRVECRLRQKNKTSLDFEVLI